MSRDFEWNQPPTAESVSRLVNFTDAVAGIALTLLVLPLLELEPPEHETIWEFMRANNGVLLAFALSFVITLMFWRRHHRMFDGLESFDAPLVALNGIWLFALVFLQFPTEVLGRVGGRGGIGTLYIGTLAVLTWLGVIIVIYLRRNPDLMPAERAVPKLAAIWTAITASYLTVAALVALVAPNGALWMLLGLVVLGWGESFQRRRAGEAAQAQQDAVAS